jgi:hypothetical protein
LAGILWKDTTFSACYKQGDYVSCAFSADTNGIMPMLNYNQNFPTQMGLLSRTETDCIATLSQVQYTLPDITKTVLGGTVIQGGTVNNDGSTTITDPEPEHPVENPPTENPENPPVENPPPENIDDGEGEGEGEGEGSEDDDSKIGDDGENPAGGDGNVNVGSSSFTIMTISALVSVIFVVVLM